MMLMPPSPLDADEGREIGWIERFALSNDRASLLDELVPGTDDFYFYQCLVHEQNGAWGDQEQTLHQWEERRENSPLRDQILHRRALLRYETAPAEALEFIQDRLGLRFDHQQERRGQAPNLPTSLDPAQVSRESFRRDSLRSSRLLDRFTPTGLDHLARNPVDLKVEQERDLLRRLQWPDYPQIVDRIARDLDRRESRGFGEFPIHSRLTETQLIELARKRADVLRDGDYLRERLLRFRPNDDVEWRFDLAAREAYLARAWDFVKDLDPAQNSLKTHVLAHLLRTQRSRGEFDRDLFLAYLALPRQASYIEPAFLNQPKFRGVTAVLDTDFFQLTGLPPVSDDRELVWSFLRELLRANPNPDPFRDYIREDQLEPLWAEVMLTSGQGDAEKWFSLLGPGRVQALRERVDIELVHGNPHRLAIDEAVSIRARLKNVPRLEIRVYEVNALNVYLDRQREIDTSIDLDGLVPNVQRVATFEQPPILSSEQTFEFPEIENRPGVWVLEFIGGGKSSRALIRKGSLEMIEEITSAGHAIRLLDGDGLPVESGAVWMGGKRFPAGDDGVVLMPFTDRPGEKTVVLEANGFASLARLHHAAEQYQLHAGIHIDREQLIARAKATIIARPVLTVAGVPTSLERLEQPELRIVTETLDGVTASTQIPLDAPITAGNAITHSFNVPDRLRQVSVELAAKIERVTDGERVDASDEHDFAINAIDETSLTRAVFLTRFADDWVLELLGKNGEPVADAPVSLAFTHRDYTVERRVSLKTDASGRIGLGHLVEIATVKALAPGARERSWTLPRPGKRTWPGLIPARAGEPVRLPAPQGLAELNRETLALFSLRQDRLLADQFERIALEPGELVITGLEPGDHRLHFRELGRSLTIRVVEGEERQGWIVGSARAVEQPLLLATSIHSIATEGANLVLKITNPTDLTRVHVLADRFFPEHDPWARLGTVPSPGSSTLLRAQHANAYVSGRLLEEEHRYILERRQGTTWPGNRLERPGLILNPWELRTSQTTTREAAEGTSYDAKGEPQAARDEEMAPDTRDSRFEEGHPSVDFLTNPAAVLTNLIPDEDGTLSIPLEQLGDRHWVRIVAGDPTQLVSVDFFREEQETEFRDLRQAEALNPNEAFARTRQAAPLGEGETLELSSTDFRVIGDPGDILPIWISLTGDRHLDEFSFLAQWRQLPAESKREKYSEFACHELHFFLFRRDPDFFTEIVRPYIANKRHKTFLDHYLLETDLSAYLQPFEFSRLNIAEKCLLARRLGGEDEAAILRHVRDAFELLPPDPSRDDQLFESVLGSQAFENLELDELELSLEREKQWDRAKPSLAAAPPGRDVLRREAPPAPATAGEANGRSQNALKEGTVEFAKKAKALDRLGMMSDQSLRSIRKRQSQLYQKQDAAKVWAENNYYRVPIEQQVASHITVNAFWRDYAAWNGEGRFFSPHFTHATRNFSEMALAMALLDLPDHAGEHEVRVEDGALKITAGSPAIVFYQEIESTADAADPVPLLVSQNFFDPENRYDMENGQRIDRFITTEFQAGKAYGCQIVMTNPSSARRHIDLLTQIPEGSLPLQNSRFLHNRKVVIESFQTMRFEYHFYFPAAGMEAPHYPVQILGDDQRIAAADPFTFNVVEELTESDTASWSYLSQYGSNDDVLAFLQDINLGRIDLAKIAWRMKEAEFFDQTIAILTRRGVQQPVLWSYAIKHDRPGPARDYLLLQETFLDRAGRRIDSPLVVSDPVQRHRYQHLEYAPFTNARAHRLGSKHRILNDDLWNQYRQFLEVLQLTSAPSSEDHLTAAYYLLLQDRIDEGLSHYDQVDPDQVAERIQYDYLTCYTAFYRNEPDRARAVAEPYADYGVIRWRNKFRNVLAQLDEIGGAAAAAQDETDRDQNQDRLASTEPTFSLEVEDGEIRVSYRNIRQVALHFYEMDLELLFSTDPFVAGDSRRFSMIQPNRALSFDLDGSGNFSTPLPEAFRSKNVLVEALAGGRRQAQTYFAHALDASFAEAFGNVQVRHADSNQPLPGTYVKVYARFSDGSVRFYKDGYTGLRGKFDYTRLNTNELDQVRRFAILLTHEEHGSLVQEVTPPVR